MTNSADQRLEELIAEWRAYLLRHSLPVADVEKLEGDLRAQAAALTAAGLAWDEAFLVAVKRLSTLDALSREYARTHLERLTQELAAWPDAAGRTPKSARTEAIVVLGLAAAAALAVKAPALLGLRLDGGESFYARNASLFVFPLLTAYFAWKRRLGLAEALWPALAFAAAAVFANVYPFRKGGDTEVLSALHLPIALWLAVGLAYVRGRWFADGGRMEFVRFSGELVIYYALIALGGGVFTGLSMMLFRAIGVDARWFAQDWLIPCGAAGAVIIASWLVEAKKSVIGHMAPVLTRLFTPLFTALLAAFLAAVAWTGNPIDVKREVLIGFDLLLALVVGLVVYAASARDPEAPPGLFDGLQLLLVASALVADGLALAAIAARISEFGLTPNRVAGLGENLILLVNLAWSAWLYGRFVLRRGSFAALERWQLAYLPVNAGWAALVVIAFPPLFGYR